MSQLSAQDAQFLYMETNRNAQHLTLLTILDPSTAPDGKVRFKQIIDHVNSRLHSSPIYRRKLFRLPLEVDYPYWVDDEDFNIENHMHHARLPHPGDWRQLCIYLSRYHSRPLDMNRPPWEMCVIEGLDNIEGLPAGSYALATKIHHAAADGMAIINFSGGLLDIDANSTPILDLSQVEPSSDRKPGNVRVAARAWLNSVRSPMKIANVVMNRAPDIVRATARTLKEYRQEANRTVPRTRFNRETSPHKVFDAVVFDLADFKQMRQLAPGCTINDVVLAVCSGGIRRYLDHHQELPGESLWAMAPVNVRSEKNGMQNDPNPGNNISSMSAPLHTDLPDPIARLNAIFQSTKDSKEARTGLSARLMTDVTRHVPASTQLVASRFVSSMDAIQNMTNVVISNVPGLQIPVYMNGARVVHQYGLAPLGVKMGLFIGTPSYNGEISFCITSSRDTMPDIDFFSRCIRESFEELKDCASAEVKPEKTTKKRATSKTPAVTKKPTAANKGAATTKSADAKKSAATTKGATAKKSSPAKKTVAIKTRAKPVSKSKKTDSTPTQSPPT